MSGDQRRYGLCRQSAAPGSAVWRLRTPSCRYARRGKSAGDSDLPMKHWRNVIWNWGAICRRRR
ncbi:hypothetical protein KCP76_19975 [Salmonella enterica subsp. enterica serovar Weltevreden]|nr:hypothetical protein KCP76_19975 [Salmonella enterica subsp. enterica serovar Weltevreden]